MAAALVLAPAGCSLGGDDEPEPATGPAREVAAVVDQLERATRNGDFAGICRDILTAAARERAGGADCERQIGSAAEGLERPTIEVTSIEAKADRAAVRLRTKAAGQALVSDTLTLRNEDGEWRVEALAE
jgi:hypothetical protein